jgi:hypothetical protein
MLQSRSDISNILITPLLFMQVFEVSEVADIFVWRNSKLSKKVGKQ